MTQSANDELLEEQEAYNLGYDDYMHNLNIGDSKRYNPYFGHCIQWDWYEHGRDCANNDYNYKIIAQLTNNQLREHYRTIESKARPLSSNDSNLLKTVTTELRARGVWRAL